MAAFVLKVKTKEQQYIIRNFTAESTVKELKNHLAEISKIPNSKIQILSGYPPKILDTSQDSFNLSACGVKSGDTLILEVKQSVAQPMKNDVSEQKTNRAHTSDVQLNSPGILMKYVVPADNSCLFTSINFVLSGKVDDTGTVSPWMRKIIAETVAADIENYSEAILGKPNTEYCNWILDDKSWGGAIEIAIMSDYYGMEIAVVDTINAIINRFGEDRDYPHRVFLLFDGIHYDPLYMESLDGGEIQTIFPTSDERILSEAAQLAKEAKSSRQYTDVDKFTLKCIVCDQHMKGQVQAQQHAQSTGHQSFGEI